MDETRSQIDQQRNPPIATLLDVMEAHERRLVEVAKTGDDEEVIRYVARLMNEAATGSSPSNLDSVFEYISIAHGLHAAGCAISDRYPEWASELHAMGQRLLTYAVTDIGQIAARVAAETMTMN